MADRAIPRISPAPRRIPAGVLVAIVADRYFTGTLWFFVPALIAAGLAAAAPTSGLRNTFLVIDAIFVVLGVRMLARSLLASWRTLHRMREGSFALGRITTCRNAWDGRSADMPYRKFLPQWVTHTGKSQVAKSMGCLGVVFGAVFLLPLALMGISLVAVIAMRALGVVDAPGPDELTTRDAVVWLAYVVVGIAVWWAVLRAFRWFVVFQAGRTIRGQLRRERGEDADARQLESMKFDPLQRMTLQVPLPSHDSGIDLICGVEYIAQGERRTGEGRLALSDRLDLAGIEPLLFSPGGHPRVLFLEWLPRFIRLDARGEWEAPAPAGPAARAAVVALAATLAIAALAPSVPGLLARVLR